MDRDFVWYDDVARGVNRLQNIVADRFTSDPDHTGFYKKQDE